MEQSNLDINEENSIVFSSDENFTNESKAYKFFNGIRGYIIKSLAVIITIISVALIFVISSLEGTKEVKASNSDNAKIIEIWREINGPGFPDEKSEIIEFDGKEYYFIIDSWQNGLPKEWHFAYDGGLDYIFGDYKFYILTFLTIAVSLIVSRTNYISSAKKARETKQFKATLIVYSKSKKNAQPYLQFIPMFCSYKNKQIYDSIKIDIISNAGITRDEYEHYDKSNNTVSYIINKTVNGEQVEEKTVKVLEKWQIKELDKIKYIKVKGISTSDLLQENSSKGNKYSMLPQSQEEHQRRYMRTGIVSKTVTSGLSGTVVAFGVIMGNWFLGMTYAFGVLISAITAFIVATDFVLNVLRNRYIAKADYLNEFVNLVEKGFFINKEKELAKKEVNPFENGYPFSSC